MSYRFSLVNHFGRLFDYTLWRHQRILDLLAKMPDSEAYLDSKCKSLYFDTPRTTLYHLVVGDQLWIMRINGTWKSGSAYKQLCCYWSDKSLLLKDARSHSMEQHRQSMKQHTQMYKDILTRVGDDQIAKGKCIYEDTSGNPASKLLSNVFTHLPNHHTHHLGQLSGSYKEATGQDNFVELDYSYFESV